MTLNIENLRLSAGERLLLRGESGSGKTTAINLLAGILSPTSGSVHILGKDISRMSSRRRDLFRGDHMGIIFQQFNLLPYLSIQENALLPCDFSALKRKKAGIPKDTATELLIALGLERELDRRQVTELSVGQQQRVAAARALIGNPEIILADEPTSALDTKTRDNFLSVLFAEAEKQGSAILMVSHDRHIADYFSRVVEMPELDQS